MDYTSNGENNEQNLKVESDVTDLNVARVGRFCNLNLEEAAALQDLLNMEKTVQRQGRFEITGITDELAEELHGLFDYVMYLAHIPIYSVKLSLSVDQAYRLRRKMISISELCKKINDASDNLDQKDEDDLNKDITEIVSLTQPTGYTLEEMFSAQIYLQALTFLEDIRYSPNYTFARPLLREFLYNRYDLQKVEMILSTGENELTTVDVFEPQKVTSFSFSNSVKLKEKTAMESPYQGIRDYLNEFLSSVSDCEIPIIHCGMSSKSSDAGRKPKSNERYRIPLTTIPEITLLFAYWDGRDFLNQSFQENPEGLPRCKESYSRLSYSVVLQKIDELIQYKVPVKSEKQVFKIVTDFRCDLLFFHRRLNRLKEYYEEYTSADFLDHILKNHEFTYTEIEGLKDFINAEIFNDPDFILKGFKSDYPDFMLPFDIMFRYNFIENRFPLKTSYESFEKTVEECKKKTEAIWKLKPTIMTDEPCFIYQSGEDDKKSVNPDVDKKITCSISTNEERLLNILRNNRFFDLYYCTENEFVKSFTADHSGDDNPAWNFELIKSALEYIEEELPPQKT